MTTEEFELLTTDTDEFMRQQGYLSTNGTAENWGITPARVRQLVQNGTIDDVHVGERRYIKKTDYPIKRRWKE